MNVITFFFCDFFLKPLERYGVFLNSLHDDKGSEDY